MLKSITGLFIAAFFLASAHAAELPDFADLIEKNSPAVVKIETIGKVESAHSQMPPDMPDIFRRFFDQRRSPERLSRSMGSGFIISKDGYILTNNHVVNDADKIVVRLNDRDEYEAEVVGTDPSTDLALLKIDAKKLPTVKFGNSESLRVGEWVVAIGSPFGLDYSASVGIVSAIGRSIPTSEGENYVPFIQTDVAINPGNSGGPLFNLKGEVIGINSQIYTRSGGSNGISFSIPAHVAQRVAKQLKEKGKVERGWLGIQMQPMDKALAESLGLDKPHGALVNAVQEDGPADKAGIEPGDVILTIDGKDVRSADDLPHIVGVMAPDTSVPVEVMREGDRRELSVTIGARSEGARFTAAYGGGSAGDDRLGLQVADLSDRERARLRVRGGVVVEQVHPESAAAEAGIQPGDVIVQIGYVRVSGIDAYRKVLPELPSGQPVAIRFFRNGRPVFRTVVIDN